jgi:hypothetical protein
MSKILERQSECPLIAESDRMRGGAHPDHVLAFTQIVEYFNNYSILASTQSAIASFPAL